jgi:hypothetical protein
VVVSSHQAGLHLRRKLAAIRYANVRFSVLSQLAESLSAGRLAAAGRSPLTAVTQGALVRRALRAAGGPLAASAKQAGLVDLVAALARELRRSDDRTADINRIRATGTTTSRAALDAIAAYESYRAEARLYDDVDVLEAAAAAVDAGSAQTILHDTGAIVVHLPTRLDKPDALLLRSLANRTTVVVALHNLDVPEHPPTIAARLGATAQTTIEAPPQQTTYTAVIAPDPIEEIRAAARNVLAATERDAVPLYRTAIVYRDEDAYATALRDTLQAAKITPAVLGGRPLADSVAARGLLGLIRLREQKFARPAVLAWLSGLPHRSGVLRSQARWDQLSRDAGVVRDAATWQTRLTKYANGREQTLAYLETETDDPTVEARRAAIERDVNDARRIVEQVAAIDAATCPPDQPTWQAHVEWALRLRDEFLTPDAAWTAEDREASQMVEEVVRGLATAHSVEPTVSVAVFLRALDDALRSRRRPDGKLGTGVVIGPHRLLLGMDFDRVHVLGALEASFPAAAPVDPLLAGDPLDRRSQREAQERSDWLGALAAADGGHVTVSAPILDIEGRKVYPSPWLLELLVDGDTHPSATAVREGSVTHPRLRRVQSADHALEGATPLNVAERRETEALAAYRAQTDLARIALARREDLPLGRTLQTARARRSTALTEFDGNVAAVSELPLVARGLTGEAQSATGIETWATCPFHFLLGRVLVVAPTEDVEDDRWWQIDAAVGGTLIHSILERFFRDVASTGHPAPGEPYSDEDVRRMETIAAEEFDKVAARGEIGHPLVWANERAAILADLRTVLREDAEQRAAGGWRPAFLEQPFGFPDNENSWPAVTVPLPDGRSIVLRGYIDRVDRRNGAARVIDYKTGREASLDVTAANLLDGGRRLQLPLYAKAVRNHERAEGRPAPATSALYWYCTIRGGFKPRGIDVDDGIETALTDVLSGIDTGVRAGCFPQVPGEFEDYRGTCENCKYCDYDSLCPAGRDVLTAAKRDDAALAPYRALQPQEPEL